MTRAEFATIIVKSLGLTPKANGKFADVAEGKWYAAYIGTANTYGIVNGRSDSATRFRDDPLAPLALCEIPPEGR